MLQKESLNITIQTWTVGFSFKVKNIFLKTKFSLMESWVHRGTLRVHTQHHHQKKPPFYHSDFYFYSSTFGCWFKFAEALVTLDWSQQTHSVSGGEDDKYWLGKKNKQTKYFGKRLFHQSALFTLPCQLNDMQTANVFLSAASCLWSLFLREGITYGLNKRLRINEDRL